MNTINRNGKERELLREGHTWKREREKKVKNKERKEKKSREGHIY